MWVSKRRKKGNKLIVQNSKTKKKKSASAWLASGLHKAQRKKKEKEKISSIRISKCPENQRRLFSPFSAKAPVAGEVGSLRSSLTADRPAGRGSCNWVAVLPCVLAVWVSHTTPFALRPPLLSYCDFCHEPALTESAIGHALCSVLTQKLSMLLLKTTSREN